MRAVQSCIIGTWAFAWPDPCGRAAAMPVTYAFPIHLAIGPYLCWLRQRSGSLLPGMMVHVLYNGSLVVVS